MLFLLLFKEVSRKTHSHGVRLFVFSIIPPSYFSLFILQSTQIPHPLRHSPLPSTSHSASHRAPQPDLSGRKRVCPQKDQFPFFERASCWCCCACGLLYTDLYICCIPNIDGLCLIFVFGMMSIFGRMFCCFFFSCLSDVFFFEGGIWCLRA